MPTQGLNHYNLRAPIVLIEQLRDFYCEIVGLEMGFRPPFASQGYWLYAGENAVLHLSVSGEHEQLAIGIPSSFDHVAFTCTELASFEEKLMRFGIAYEKAQVPASTQVQLFFRDPAENGVELNFASAEYRE